MRYHVATEGSLRGTPMAQSMCHSTEAGLLVVQCEPVQKRRGGEWGYMHRDALWLAL